MSNNQATTHEKHELAIPQIRVSTHLHAGASLEACQKSLKDWQTNYYKWYEKVNASKPTPCNNL